MITGSDTFSATLLIGCNPAKKGKAAKVAQENGHWWKKKKVKNREKVVKLAKQREI
jgi:hypothetical protein